MLSACGRFASGGPSSQGRRCLQELSDKGPKDHNYGRFFGYITYSMWSTVYNTWDITTRILHSGSKAQSKGGFQKPSFVGSLAFGPGRAPFQKDGK